MPLHVNKTKSMKSTRMRKMTHTYQVISVCTKGSWLKRLVCHYCLPLDNERLHVADGALVNSSAAEGAGDSAASGLLKK